MVANASDATRRRQSQNAATDRATIHARLGNTPVLVATELLRDALREQYQVRSRAITGQVYHVDLLVDRAGVVTTTCDCLAGSTDRCCWHRAAARLCHHDAIAFPSVIAYRLRPKVTRQPAPITAAMLSGKAR